jgi:hypothetical protein|tara:strand:- start:3096 stop:3497 length:402 start_codon:yes stop_codon:yes gene_type:complete
MPDVRSLKKFIRLEQQRRTLEAKLTKLKTEIAESEELAKQWFEANGVSQFKADNTVVYIHKQLWASKQEGVIDDELRDAFDASGLSEFVKPKMNVQSFSAHCRELAAEGEELPQRLRPLIKLTETYKLRTRKS